MTSSAGLQIMSADGMKQTLVRMGHEILERNAGVKGMTFVGIDEIATILAQRVAAEISGVEGGERPCIHNELIYGWGLSPGSRQDD